MNTRSGLVVAALLASSLTARASDEHPGDGAYGRFAGDLGVAGAAGITAGPRGPRATLDARLRYLSTAGVFATYEDGPLLASAAEPRRALAFGLEVRPLFLARWAQGWELGNARLDMLIDSLALELGAAFVEPAGARFGARPALQAGLGLELPFFADASGPFLGLHGGARWSEHGFSGGPLDGPSDRALFLSVVIGWQALFGGHLVDFDDRRRVGAAR